MRTQEPVYRNAKCRSVSPFENLSSNILGAFLSLIPRVIRIVLSRITAEAAAQVASAFLACCPTVNWGF